MLLVIRRNHQTGEVSLDPLRWGLIPYWCKDPSGGRKPINAKCETVRDLPTFRDAYRKRRCIVPVDGFFEWKAIKGQRPKQPYAIAMKDGTPFGLAGIWENWKEPAAGEWLRTFAIITTDANELVADIHDRMPVILAPGEYARWLGEEFDPRDLMQPFPADLMRMWPISTLVNKLENDGPSIVEPIELATDAAQQLSRSPRACHIFTCMKPSVIVWDLETVPDLAGFAPPMILSASRTPTFVKPSATGFRSTSTTPSVLMRHSIIPL